MAIIQQLLQNPVTYPVLLLAFLVGLRAGRDSHL